MSLSVSGNMLYGICEQGGSYDWECVFSIKNDGTNFKIIHSFRGTNDGGKSPIGVGLLVINSKIYCADYSNYGPGIIFRMKTDGSAYTILHTFGSGTDGSYPSWGTMVYSGNTLYGSTEHGGTSGHGNVYSLTIPSPRIGAEDGEDANNAVTLGIISIMNVYPNPASENVNLDIYSTDKMSDYSSSAQ